uniref:Uncharacterized protein n=1 Tax=Chromera velia CCMP2878 TaxID=1169474 RepID=A0A0G4H8H9_9ALVE|eukprot:Cvel_25175.t1-p1 / transcript=Cvel_25175.t1 / gene=Cvel_25175 / organism=Chromera_velia_CCMP2878 / gene_product=hypothetical protein / transcript_product=hypothetical protein / location=Cvel_scaffold2817:11801-16053(+) / protein_length=232 / sequence_SO=supercontig / SO=protein_coding / is_pseudo=false
MGSLTWGVYEFPPVPARRRVIKMRQVITLGRTFMPRGEAKERMGQMDGALGRQGKEIQRLATEVLHLQDSKAVRQALRNEGGDVVNAIVSLTSSSSSSSSLVLRPAEGGPQGGMGGKGNEGTELGDVKMTGVEGSEKKVNGRRERDRDIKRREAKAKMQRVRVPAETALEDRAPAQKRERQPRGSKDVEGRAEIKGLARPEKATLDVKVPKFSIATPELDMQINTPGPTEQQ